MTKGAWCQVAGWGSQEHNWGGQLLRTMTAYLVLMDHSCFSVSIANPNCVVSLTYFRDTDCVTWHMCLSHWQTLVPLSVPQQCSDFPQKCGIISLYIYMLLHFMVISLFYSKLLQKRSFLHWLQHSIWSCWSKIVTQPATGGSTCLFSAVKYCSNSWLPGFHLSFSRIRMTDVLFKYPATLRVLNMVLNKNHYLWYQ